MITADASKSQLTSKMYDGVEGMALLKDRWNALWQSNNGISVQCYSYCLHSWTHIHKRHRRKIQCAAVFDGDELVAVWPLISSYKGPWKVVRPLGPATAEFTEPLVKRCADAVHYMETLWSVVKRYSGADLINLPFVREPTPLNAVLQTERDIIGKEYDFFHHLTWPDGATKWQDYYGTLGSNHRKKLAQRRRSFEKVGKVTYDVITDPNEMEPLMYWIMENKRQWAKHIGLENPGYWLTSDDYVNFLIDWAHDTSRPEQVRVDVLRLDGKPVAAFVVCVGTGWLEWIIGGYDGEYTKWSPGMILQYEFVQWGFEHNLEPDFGIGKEDNKKFWCGSQSGGATIYHIANSAWGKFGYKMLYTAFQKFKKRDIKVERPVEALDTVVH